MTLEEDDDIKRVFIEVKNSSQPKAEHAKKLKLKSIEGQGRKLVVYMGDTQIVGGIQYVNAYDFLTNMAHWIGW